MRIVCPGSTILEPSPAPAGSSKRVHIADKDKGKKVLNPSKRRTKIEQILEARKKDEAKKKEKLRKEQLQQMPLRTNHIFVGNLEVNVTEDELRRHFRSCGRIFRVDIRCSRGQVVNIKRPNDHLTPRDRKYAAILFQEQPSILQALKKNGTLMGKQRTKLIVVAFPDELPEAKEIGECNRIKEMDPDAAKSMPPPNGMHGTRRKLAYERTEVIFDPENPSTDKFRMGDYSFPKTIA